MKVGLPYFDDEYDGVKLPSLARKLRELMRSLEQAFAKLRIDDQIIIGGGTPILKHLSTTATWDPANLASGAPQSTDVTLTGAASGDEVSVSFSLPLQGTHLWGEVISSNTVRVYQRNDTGGAVNLASGTLRVSVWQH